MFDRMILWAYNQNPVFWESISVAVFIIFIVIMIGVN